MTILQESNQEGTKALLTCFLTLLLCTVYLFIISENMLLIWFEMKG